ncbi:MAG TPA: SDR family oxidoreductase [Gammaproteobacteria bacterium]|nr:SDR family oxidoreductase [Gammaproteobacteria bacterium]
MNLRESTVLITGAGGGIGSALAERLARAGARLVLTDLQAAPLELLAAKLTARGAAVATVAADIGADAGRAAVVASAVTEKVNVLINVAGINPFGLYPSQPAADIGKTMLINAVAPMLLCHALLPSFAGLPRAHIVNVGSTFGSVGFPGFCTYSASKFALRGFSEALRRELADTSIRVHYVAPRATSTALATSRVRALNQDLGAGMDSPETVAAAIEDTLRRERRETFLGLPERLLAVLNGLWPSIVDRSLLNRLAAVRKHATDGAADVDRHSNPSLPPRSLRS